MKTTLEQYNLERHAEKMRKQIANWDHEDADELRDLLIDFTNTRETLERDRIYIADIDGSNLPSESFPNGFDTTGYWALDKNGYAVRGISWEEHELEVVEIL
jgi:hypothetical protein